MHFLWGTLLASADRAAKHPASYDSTGVRYVWHPTVALDGPAALDVERLDTPPRELAASLSHPDFLQAWTRLEVLAKLADEPILTRLRREPLIVPPPESPYHHTEPSGATYRLHSGFWAKRQIIFTCGYRVA